MHVLFLDAGVKINDESLLSFISNDQQIDEFMIISLMVAIDSTIDHIIRMHDADPFPEINFQTINNEAELKNITEIATIALAEAAGRDEKSHKQHINDLLSKVQGQISSKAFTPKSKLMSLLLLREFTEKHALAQRKEDKHSKLFSILASHSLLRDLKNIAQDTDPLKQVHQKGKSLFQSSSTIGNDFIRLTLELIRFWASRFPATSKKEPTSYKRFYDQLTDRKVTFPTEYKFLAAFNKKTNEEGMYDTGRIKPSAPQPNPSVLAPPPPSQPAASLRSTIKSQIYRMYNRLLNFVESLDEEISVVEPEIRNVHTQIKSDMKKYENMQDEVLQIAQRENDSEIVTKYFAVIEFMQKELQFHQQYISNSNDYQSYILAIKLEAQKNFPQLNGNTTPQTQPQPKTSDKRSENQNPITKKESKKDSIAPPQQKSSFDQKAVVQVSNYFSRLEERSKSPIAGFKKINDSLSREKSSTLKRSVSPISRSKNNITKSMASLKESKISPIFTSPPNLFPSPRSYEGRQILENQSLGTVLKVITKSQGLRRFKTANFKGKSSLFENEHLQIGYKSESIYEEISGFKVMIKIELYFGNLTDERIHNLSLDFKGDPNILLYANPRTIETSLLRSDQNKIDLIIVPLKVPFPMLNMTLRYDIKQETTEHRVVIPNSVLKLAHYMSISKQQFGKRWISADIIRTTEARLCHYLPPDTFTRWISELGELSSYTAFAVPGSNKDYQLYCAVIMMQRHEALLKINIRPNLDVIIQLGIEDRNEQASQYFTYYLETLQQLLKEVS